MRSLALILLLASGCSLYFDHSADHGVPPDALVIFDGPSEPPPGSTDPGQDFVNMARCEDGQLFALETQRSAFRQPGHGAGCVFARCGGACQSDAVFCTRPDCSDAVDALCKAPASAGTTCPLAGTACSTGDTIDCPTSTACSMPLAGSACHCADGHYQCAQSTSAAEVQASLVGKWSGTMTTPGFAAPYPISLWIYPDGTYWAECTADECLAFYYGGDGPLPTRKISILSASADQGAWADIAIDFGYSPALRGELSGLTVDSSTLRFTYSAAWLTCGQPFEAILTRE
jgi:hypothetical protein